MSRISSNTVKNARPGRPFDHRLSQLARFAIEWANDPDVDGKDVSAWIQGFETFQGDRFAWGDEFIYWEPHTFPKNGQIKVHDWLSTVLEKPLNDSLKKTLNEQAATIKGSYVFEWVDEFDGPLETLRMEGSALALAALGTMAIASRELRDGFGRCEYCGRFFLETTTRRGPRGRRFCPTRSCGIASRVQKFNERQGK